MLPATAKSIKDASAAPNKNESLVDRKARVQHGHPHHPAADAGCRRPGQLAVRRTGKAGGTVSNALGATKCSDSRPVATGGTCTQKIAPHIDMRATADCSSPSSALPGRDVPAADRFELDARRQQLTEPPTQLVEILDQQGQRPETAAGGPVWPLSRPSPRRRAVPDGQRDSTPRAPS